MMSLGGKLETQLGILVENALKFSREKEGLVQEGF